MSERVSFQAMTPMRQQLDAGCGPTSIAMVFSGFGVNLTERELAEKYFPTAKIPIIDWVLSDGEIKPGLFDVQIVRGITQIIDDLGLSADLQLDVFSPQLYQFTSSPEEKYIVRASPGAAKKESKLFKGQVEWKDFFETLEEMSKKGKIGVYTANPRTMKFSKNPLAYLPRESREGFEAELFDFVRQGHIVGPHGGMTAHVRALDGTRIEPLDYLPDKRGFVMLDPARDKTSVTSVGGLVWVDSTGIRGDTFDNLIRVSPRRDELNPQAQGFRGFLQNLRHLIP